MKILASISSTAIGELPKNDGPMKVRIKPSSLGLSLAVVALTSTSAVAQTQVGPVPIVQFTSGWGADNFTLGTGATAVNPAGCSANDLYNSFGSDPGYKTYLATVLTAITNGMNVTLEISNTSCSQGRPMIIGVTLNP